MFIDRSGPRDDYFLSLQEALRQADIASPVLVLDRERLNANLDFLRADVPSSLAVRLVSKSLPCLPLLQHARSALRTDRLMTFNLPMLIDIAREMPDADQMLGKPMPVAAAAQFFQEDLEPRAYSSVHFLIDTKRRLDAYAGLARSMNRQLSVVLELDIGLHRGGFEPGPELAEALQRLARSSTLTFNGFMGYEAHLAKVPTLGGWRTRWVARAGALYRKANTMAAEIFGERAVSKALRNVAGSPTYRFYRDDRVANEISIGSALVKPTDFETDLLEPYQPALFVATPALKVLPTTRIPVLEALDRVKRWLDPNLAQAVFIHGGYWKAHPVDPPGLRTNATYGRSTNQELLNVGSRTHLEADDFVFLRPTQSEAVMLQFGRIAVYDSGSIRDLWPTLPASA
ncbi:MAG: alanine racemase [Acidobacteriota bacterium]